METIQFKELAANRDTVTIEGKGIPNIISIDRSKAVPSFESERKGPDNADNTENDTQETKRKQSGQENSEKAEERAK